MKKRINISLDDVLFAFSSCPALQSKYKDMYDMAVDLKQYEGTWEGYKYSKNRGNGREYYTKTQNYTIYLSFVLLPAAKVTKK